MMEEELKVNFFLICNPLILLLFFEAPNWFLLSFAIKKWMEVSLRTQLTYFLQFQGFFKEVCNLRILIDTVIFWHTKLKFILFQILKINTMIIKIWQKILVVLTGVSIDQRLSKNCVEYKQTKLSCLFFSKINWRSNFLFFLLQNYRFTKITKAHSIL